MWTLSSAWKIKNSQFHAKTISRHSCPFLNSHFSPSTGICILHKIYLEQQIFRVTGCGAAQIPSRGVGIGPPGSELSNSYNCNMGVCVFFSTPVRSQFKKHWLWKHYICLSLSKLIAYRCQDVERCWALNFNPCVRLLHTWHGCGNGTVWSEGSQEHVSPRGEEESGKIRPGRWEHRRVAHLLSVHRQSPCSWWENTWLFGDEYPTLLSVVKLVCFDKNKT